VDTSPIGASRLAQYQAGAMFEDWRKTTFNLPFLYKKQMAMD